MNEDEDFLFQQEMADVKPLQSAERVRLTGERLPAGTVLQRRASAVAEAGDGNPLSVDGIASLDSWYVLDFKHAGVQNGVFRKLKQGRYESEARLNLHRMGVKRARRELFEFVRQAEELGMRSVLVIHGKGENSAEQEQASIIKGSVNHWLRQFEQVLAFHSARPQHGGTGAVYVLLRKSEQQKQLNRERFNKHRGRE
jgi:DNA-nicking Smr family endonuclease